MIKTALKIRILQKNGAVWRDLAKGCAQAGAVSVHAGVLAGAKNEDGENIAEYAAANEFGAPDIPARPFMRKAARECGGDWAKILASALKGRLMHDKGAAARALTAVGRTAQADIQSAILSNVPPPNSPEYAKSKQKKHGGYSGTLFLSGDMYRSINFEVCASARETARK